MIQMKRKLLDALPAALLALGLLMQTGCAVTQPPGKGRCARFVEPSTQTGYWLYLPQDFMANQGRHPAGQRWPIVVTFHGLRPYDDANPQIREWQVEADRYNFIVIAPELRTCDTLIMVPPLNNPDFGPLKTDEEAVLAIMDEVTRRTDADPSRVLATSFSSGGYLAHYMVNRHPERFSCIAVRGSNFSEGLMDASQVSKYRDMKIGIYFGENDIALCVDESMRAVDWYRMHRFHVTAKKLGGMGHERKPEVAAAFFASSIGVNPKTPPDLALVVMKDVVPAGSSFYPTRREPRPAPRVEPRGSAVFSPSSDLNANASPTAKPLPPRPGAQPLPTATPAPTVQRSPSPTRVVPRNVETPKRPTAPLEPEVGKAAPRSPQRTRPPLVFTGREQTSTTPLPASIRLHGDPVGDAPHQVSLSIALADRFKTGATVLWTDNDRPITVASGFEAQLRLEEPGQHHIAAHIITADNRKSILRKTITVVEPTTQPAS